MPDLGPQQGVDPDIALCSPADDGYPAPLTRDEKGTVSGLSSHPLTGRVLGHGISDRHTGLRAGVPPAILLLLLIASGVLYLAITDLFSPLVVCVLAGYPILGASAKYVDQVCDEGLFDRRIAYVLALISGTIMGLLCYADLNSATIFIPLCIALLLTRKIDAAPFALGTALVFGFFFSSLSSNIFLY